MSYIRILCFDNGTVRVRRPYSRGKIYSNVTPASRHRLSELVSPKGFFTHLYSNGWRALIPAE